MNAQEMDEALDAIHAVALEVLENDLQPGIKAKVQLILSLARFKHDVRTEAEKKPLGNERA